MEDTNVCPVTKKHCVLYDIGSGERHWCDDRGDPSEYEVCPIPKKAERANKKAVSLSSKIL